MKSKRKSLVLIMLVVLIVSSTAGQAFAESMKDLKNKQDKIKKQIKSNQTEIKDIENKSNDLSKEIAEIDRKLNTASAELDMVEKELNAIEKDIEKNEEELREAEENLNEREDLFKSRLRVMYMNNKVSYLELLLTSTSIKDFFSRQEMIQSIAEHDTELIEYMKEQRDIIEKKKTELKAQRASVEVTRSRLKSRKDDLAKVSREKESVMSRLKSDKVALEKSMNILDDDSKKIDNQIAAAQKAQEAKAAAEAEKNKGSQNSQGQSSNNPYSGGKMAWPVPGHSRISSYFGYRIHPVSGGSKLHAGIDIPAPTGTPIKAALGGTVIISQSYGGYGNTISIDHGGGIVTLYAHNSSLSVSVGQKVSQGQTIARAGSTGVSTGPHCHFEVRQNNKPVNPLSWLR